MIMSDAVETMLAASGGSAAVGAMATVFVQWLRGRTAKDAASASIEVAHAGVVSPLLERMGVLEDRIDQRDQRIDDLERASVECEDRYKECELKSAEQAKRLTTLEETISARILVAARKEVRRSLTPNKTIRTIDIIEEIEAEKRAKDGKVDE